MIEKSLHTLIAHCGPNTGMRHASLTTHSHSNKKTSNHTQCLRK